MATFSSVTRQHVLQAIAEHDARGSEEFLEVYGFAPSPDHTIVHEGRTYDAKSVLGVAHRFATGRLATPDEFSGDLPGAVAILRKRGFEVTEPPAAYRPVQPSTPRTRTPRTPGARSTAARSTAARDAPPALCPTCSMTLPATGVCDYCS
ncbi:MAG TPA: hypothetical protein PLS68_12210 [Actinotalea sp.]|nr:hypothetical protein [Actinotalea sp.]